jgi:hypothetical protein
MKIVAAAITGEITAVCACQPDSGSILLGDF